MVVRDNETYEGIAQRLNGTLKPGSVINLPSTWQKSANYESRSRVNDKETNYVTPAVFRIWGGKWHAVKKELLGESAPVNHSDWRTYQFKVKPKAEYKYILIEAYYKSPAFVPYCGHILVDNLTDFDEMDCDEGIATCCKQTGCNSKGRAKTNFLP